MGRLLSTLGLVVVLAGLGAYIYFVDNKRPASDAETKAKAFGEVTADDIEELQITLEGGDTSTLRRVDNRWQIVEPAPAEADNSEVNNMASSLASLEVQRVVDEAPSDLAQFGLATPHLEIGFKRKGQANYQRLQLDEKTPTGGDIYARRADEKRVILVSSFMDDTFKRSAFDLRDKTLFKFDRDKVTGFELTNASGSMRFVRKGASWMFAEPRSMRADFAALETTITSFSATLMQKFVADNATPAELTQYGLAKPTVTASVVLGNDRSTLVLGRTDNAETYARDASKPAIVMVAPTIVEDLNKKLNDFRRKDVFDLRSFSTKSVEIVRGTETLKFQKTTADGKDVWKDASGKAIDTAKIEDVLSKLSNIRAQGFDDRADPALRTPVVVVTAHYGQNKDEDITETVTLARAGQTVVASRPDEPGTLRVEGSPLDDVLKGIDALK